MQEPAECVCHPQGKQYPKLHPKRGKQQGKGGDCPILLCPCETLPAVLHPGLGPSKQERHGFSEAGLEEATKITEELKHHFQEERLRKFSLFIQRSLQKDLITYQYLEGTYMKDKGLFASSVETGQGIMAFFKNLAVLLLKLLNKRTCNFC